MNFDLSLKQTTKVCEQFRDKASGDLVN